jgi:hypothetical protein
VDENKQDKPLSSEEMLRRARSGLGDAKSTPVEKDPREPASTSYDMQPSFTPEFEVAPPPMDTASLDYSEPDPGYEDPVDAVETTDSSYDSNEDWAAPPTSPIEDDNVAGWAPPLPTPIEDTPRAPSQPRPPRSTNSSGATAGRVIALVIGIGLIGAVMVSFFDSSKSVNDIAAGTCMNLPEDAEFSTYDPIDCSEPHEVEVFAIIDMATVSSEYSIGVSYPGDDAIYYAAVDECVGQPFETFVGMPYDSVESTDTVLWVDAFTPTLEGWDEYDDREVQCVLLDLDTTNGDIVKTTGSYKNSGQ